jgi:predicted RNase H-like HicB family nuclease
MSVRAIMARDGKLLEEQPMQIPVLIEPVAGNGYRARGSEPFALTAEGSTREDALRKLRELIEIKLKAGAEIVPLEIPNGNNPWLRMAGTLDLDDPLVKPWQAIMEENRRKADEDPDYLKDLKTTE